MINSNKKLTHKQILNSTRIGDYINNKFKIIKITDQTVHCCYLNKVYGFWFSKLIRRNNAVIDTITRHKNSQIITIYNTGNKTSQVYIPLNKPKYCIKDKNISKMSVHKIISIYNELNNRCIYINNGSMYMFIDTTKNVIHIRSFNALDINKKFKNFSLDFGFIVKISILIPKCKISNIIDKLNKFLSSDMNKILTNESNIINLDEF